MANAITKEMIKKIAAGDKHGWTNIEIQFDENGKFYPYYRRMIHVDFNHYKSVINGTAIHYDSNYNFLEVVQEYEPKQEGRRSTKQKSPERKISEKIREEAEEQEVKIPEVKKVEIPEGEIRHEQYDTIKACLECNIPVYLAGPAGTGKNYTVEQIAKELGWNFYFSNSIQQEHKLTGFIDAGGNFHETEFYKACTDENDCVFFLDEMDASIPEVLVLLNAAIANGYFVFPTGKVELKKVHFVAAGNTVGSGADDQYTGRMVLDQATMDRFAIIEMNYDRRVELKIAEGNAELVEFVHQLREKAETLGIRATFSYRCIAMVTKLEKTGLDVKAILKISIFKGMDQDTINTMSGIRVGKYSA